MSKIQVQKIWGIYEKIINYSPQLFKKTVVVGSASNILYHAITEN